MKQTSEIISLVSREMQYRNYSVRTVKTYTEILEKVERDLQGVSLSDVPTEQFKDYLFRRVNKDKISSSMVNQYISVWKILQTDVLKRNAESIKVKRPRREKKLPVVLSQQEVEALIKATRNIKHRALLMLTYSAGLRRQELQFMKPSAIDSEQMRVHVVQGKGKKDRFTLLSPKVLEYLRMYFKIERPKVYLFETQIKKGNPLSEQTLNSIIKNSVRKAGIKKRVSFHTLRHCFATHLLEQGVSLRLIQDFLGHVSIHTTAVYLHLANIKTSGIISPLDGMDV